MKPLPLIKKKLKKLLLVEHEHNKVLKLLFFLFTSKYLIIVILSGEKQCASSFFVGVKYCQGKYLMKQIKSLNIEYLEVLEVPRIYYTLFNITLQQEMLSYIPVNWRLYSSNKIIFHIFYITQLIVPAAMMTA